MTTDYITLQELRDYLHDTSALDAGPAGNAITAASRDIDAVCGRYFSQDASTSVQYFYPDSYCKVCVDDISTTTGLLVDVDATGDGTYGQSWTINTDFFLEPINQNQGGVIGWPYTEIHATLASKYFPVRQATVYIRPTVRVTAKWGWAAVPAAVKQACFVMAAQYYKMGDAPFGTAGFGEYGMLRVKENPVATALLRPFMIDAGYAVA